MTALLYCVAAGVPILVSAPWSRRWVKATLAGNMAIPLMIVTFLLPSLVSAAIATHLHYRMHRRVGCAPGPLTAYALTLLAVASVVAGMLGGVLTWDE